MHNKIKIKSFPASYGESFFIKLYGEKNINILIDCGFSSTAELINEELKVIKNKGEKLDLLILTHIDNDHINGAKKVLDFIIKEEIELGEVWHNDYSKIIEVEEENKTISEEAESFINSISNTKDEQIYESISKEKVGYKEAVYLSDFLYNEKIYNKWNKSFRNKKICVENNKIKKIILNKEVTISILGPKSKNLDNLYKEWNKFLNDNLKRDIVSKSKKFSNAFEKFLLNIYKEYRYIERSKCSIYNIKDMIEYEKFDEGIVNRSSIIVIIEFNNKKLLFLGDSSPIDLNEILDEYIKINSNKFDVIKISHHGSKNNLSKDFISKVNCKKFIISTNGNLYNHPDIECFAKILYLSKNNPKIYLNYKSPKIINNFSALGRDISDLIIYENIKPNDKKVLCIDL